MDKYEVAQMLREIGMAIEIADINPKKSISYYKAAHSIETAFNFEHLIKENDFTSLPGIGIKISQMIKEMISKGNLSYHKELLKHLPLTLFELRHIPGLSLQKIRALYERLNITTLKQLEEAIRKNKIVKVPGFQPSYLKKLAKRIAIYKKKHSILLPQADVIALNLLEILKPFAKEALVTGEIRRRLELISQIEILVVSDKKEECLNQFTRHSVVDKILLLSKNIVKVRLKSGIPVKISFVPARRLSHALFVTTGSASHIKELKLPKKELSENVYVKLNLPFIVPELREGRGEVAASKKGAFNNLVSQGDLRGIFHSHTVASDGRNTLDELAKAAIKRGWEYVGISDHSQSSYQAGGMKIEELLSQVEEIKKLNSTFTSFQLLAGIECDILKDGF